MSELRKTPSFRLQYVDCAMCRACNGGGYQAPPAFFAGSIEAKVLVIAQNPGEIKETDRFRLMMASSMREYAKRNESFGESEALLRWYQADFASSSMCTRMELVFGKGWISNGKFMYTNSVRCRTIKNEMPTDEMKQNCKTWTDLLIQIFKPKAIILAGNLASSQLLTDDEVLKIDVGTAKIHPKYGIVARIQHPSIWTEDSIDVNKRLVKRILDKIGSDKDDD